MTKAEIKQLEMLRTKTPEQRFAMMTDLIGAQFDAMRAGIKFQNPGITRKELNELLKNRLRQIYLTRNDCTVKTKSCPNAWEKDSSYLLRRNL